MRSALIDGVSTSFSYTSVRKIKFRNEQDRRTCHEHRLNKMQVPLHSFHSRFKGIEKFLRTLHELTLEQNTEQEIEQEYNHALLTAAIQKVVSYPYTNIYSTRINHL